MVRISTRSKSRAIAQWSQLAIGQACGPVAVFAALHLHRLRGGEIRGRDHGNRAHGSSRQVKRPDHACARPVAARARRGWRLRPRIMVLGPFQMKGPEFLVVVRVLIAFIASRIPCQRN
jgi:hypothetical protein